MILQLVKHTAETRDAMRIDLDAEVIVQGYRMGGDRPGAHRTIAQGLKGEKIVDEFASEIEVRPATVLEWNIPRGEVHYAEAIAVRHGRDWHIHSFVGMAVRGKYDGATLALSKPDMVALGPRGYYQLKEMLEAAKGKPGGMRVNPSRKPLVR